MKAFLVVVALCGAAQAEPLFGSLGFGHLFGASVSSKDSPSLGGTLGGSLDGLHRSSTSAVSGKSGVAEAFQDGLNGVQSSGDNVEVVKHTTHTIHHAVHQVLNHGSINGGGTPNDRPEGVKEALTTQGISWVQRGKTGSDSSSSEEKRQGGSKVSVLKINKKIRDSVRKNKKNVAQGGISWVQQGKTGSDSSSSEEKRQEGLKVSVVKINKKIRDSVRKNKKNVAEGGISWVQQGKTGSDSSSSEEKRQGGRKVSVLEINKKIHDSVRKNKKNVAQGGVLTSGSPGGGSPNPGSQGIHSSDGQTINQQFTLGSGPNYSLRQNYGRRTIAQGVSWTQEGPDSIKEDPQGGRPGRGGPRNGPRDGRRDGPRDGPGNDPREGPRNGPRDGPREDSRDGPRDGPQGTIWGQGIQRVLDEENGQGGRGQISITAVRPGIDGPSDDSNGSITGQIQGSVLHQFISKRPKDGRPKNRRPINQGQRVGDDDSSNSSSEEQPKGSHGKPSGGALKKLRKIISQGISWVHHAKTESDSSSSEEKRQGGDAKVSVVKTNKKIHDSVRKNKKSVAQGAVELAGGLTSVTVPSGGHVSVTVKHVGTSSHPAISALVDSASSGSLSGSSSFQLSSTGSSSSGSSSSLQSSSSSSSSSGGGAHSGILSSVGGFFGGIFH